LEFNNRQMSSMFKFGKAVNSLENSVDKKLSRCLTILTNFEKQYQVEQIRTLLEIKELFLSTSIKGQTLIPTNKIASTLFIDCLSLYKKIMQKYDSMGNDNPLIAQYKNELTAAWQRLKSNLQFTIGKQIPYEIGSHLNSIQDEIAFRRILMWIDRKIA
jgi:hypothetical protein